ncbi:2-hydroxyacyl-CoA dehydratase family protein [Dehalobacter sp. DCM]|uniref:2-hydroxyacyl-CoA dehydratase family protein n=1 Tax=Dehalobacter sp. DCM TaxID=2907827 RepID=UPI00308138D3|nr:2-hydroxyacyl-CoA dehydratase family protein [Dehalobacter sp. DCM]
MNYNELFNMCGLDDEWQAQNKERIEKFLYQMYIRSDQDIADSVAWTKKQYDTSLPSTRQFLAVLMKEAMDYALARDEREIIINYTRPTMASLSQGFHVWENRINAELGYNKFYARGTSIVYLMIVLGTIFNKANWCIELSEDLGQTAGKGHCSEYQIWEGALFKGMIPAPDVEVSCGLFCDQAPEVEAKMAVDYNFDVVFTDLPEDHPWDTWPHMDINAIKYLSKNTEAVYDYLREKYGFTMSEDDKSQGVLEANQFITAHMAIVNLVATTDGLPVSHADMFLSFISAAIGSVYKDEVLAAMKQMQKDIRKRIREESFIVPPGAPRAYGTFVAVADMRFYHQVEEAGIHLTHVWFEPIPPEVFSTPPASDIPREQGYEMIFRFQGLGDLCGSSIKQARFAVENFNLDGLMIFETMFCRPLCLPSVQIKDYVQKHCNNIPVMRLELDAYDSRNYTPEQYRTRLESFAEVMRMRKAMKEISAI